MLDVMPILIRFHPDKPEESLNVLLLEFLILHPPTNH